MSWFVYMLRCADNTLYTGVTTDVERRLEEHNVGPKGAKYTKARRPVKLVYTETCKDRSAAQIREFKLRHLPKVAKVKLIKTLDKNQ